MNRIFKTLIVLAVGSLVAISAAAQDKKTFSAPWASDKGYWVVESNTNSPLNHTIRFYSNDDMLLYKEVLTGVKLNPEKRKVKMKLKKVLETNILVWQQQRAGDENKNYVAKVL